MTWVIALAESLDDSPVSFAVQAVRTGTEAKATQRGVVTVPLRQLAGLAGSILVGSTSASVCSAATLVVDLHGTGDDTEIQPAIDAADDGDTVLVKPGESAIRLPRALRKRSAEFHYPRDLATTWTGWRQDVREAESALVQARGLVTIPNAGGRYSTRILPDPTTLRKARAAVARAIESLIAARAR